MRIQSTETATRCYAAPSSVSGNVTCDNNGYVGPTPESVIVAASSYSAASLSVSLGSPLGSPVTVTLEWGPMGSGTPLDDAISYSEANLHAVASCTIAAASLTCQTGSVTASVPAGSLITVSTSPIATLSTYNDAAVLTTVTLQ